MLLLINSAAHLLVDALCAATLFGAVQTLAPEKLSACILLYNTLAFSTQCLVGLAADRIKKHAYSSSAAMLITVLGFALPLSPVLKVILIGAGNSVFHVASGSMTLERSGGRLGPLGLFVAPGAIGLMLGTLFPELGIYFAAGLTFASLMLVLTFRWEDEPCADGPVIPARRAFSERALFMPLLSLLLLSLAVAVRAVGGAVADFPWNKTALSTALLAVFVSAGKAAGGLVADRFGVKPVALISIPVAAVLTAFLSGHMAPALIGQFALNLTMPITLYLMYAACPDRPGFTFGLAASALWPGTIAGRALSSLPQIPTVLAVFAFALAAVLFTSSVLLDKKKQKRKHTASK